MERKFKEQWGAVGLDIGKTVAELLWELEMGG